MNKKILLLPAFAAVALLAACGGDDTLGAPPAAPATAAPSQPPVAVVHAADYTLAADAPAAGHCALDAINGGGTQGVVLPASGHAVFGGWIANAALDVPTDAMFVLRGDQGSLAAPLDARWDRPDVAQALGSEALANAGFNLQLSLDGVPAGSYELLAMVDAATGATCNFNVTLVLE